MNGAKKLSKFQILVRIKLGKVICLVISLSKFQVLAWINLERLFVW